MKYKDLYSNKIVFLNLVKEILKVPWAKDLSEENLVLVDKEYIKGKYFCGICTACIL